MQWQRYHATMLYFSVANLLYHYLCQGYLLWYLVGDPIVSHHAVIEALYTFFVYPSCVLLFLAHAPRRRPWALALHVAKWVVLFFGIELVYLRFGFMNHEHGWNVWWSLLFDCIMFPMLLLHERRPILAYAISFVLAVLFLYIHDVPAHSSFL